MSETFSIVVVKAVRTVNSEKNRCRWGKPSESMAITITNESASPILERLTMTSVLNSIDKKQSGVRQGKFSLQGISRNGISALETTVVMAMIVGSLTLLLGGFAGPLTGFFDQTTVALGHSATGSKSPVDDYRSTVTDNVSPVPSDTHSEVQRTSQQLLRLGIFTCSVLVFLAYTVVFMSKAESDGKEPANEKLAENPLKNGLADQLMDKRSRIGRLLRDEMKEYDSDQLVVAKFMTANPTIATVNDQVTDIMDLMVKRGFRHLIVVNDNQEIAGIISDRDLVNVAGKSVAEIMTPNPYWVDAMTPVSIAITMLVKNRISALPVVLAGKVVGILTRSDLLITLQCLLVSLQEDLPVCQLPPART